VNELLTSSNPFRKRIVPYTGTIIFIGASTGGTEAIREVLTRLPAGMPPILMTQHMPEMFTGSFAQRLDSMSAISVKEAEQGEIIEPGVAYLAPGHSHLLIKKAERGGYLCELSRGEPVNRHRPSVDVLFNSAAEQVGTGAIGVLLTGMGKDGAAGLLRMMKAGAWTIGQDKASCVVYGMPREAALLGALKEVVTITEVAAHILQRLGGEFHSNSKHPRV
jgi:two-component system chemotaxis response regulator CheB